MVHITHSSHSQAYQTWHWIKDQVIQDVPPEIAACEFVCRKPYCPVGYWEVCQNRKVCASFDRVTAAASKQCPTN